MVKNYKNSLHVIKIAILSFTVILERNAHKR